MVKFGDVAPEQVRHCQLMVTDSSFIEAKDKLLSEKEFHKLRRHSFLFGLEKLELISREHASFSNLEAATKIFGTTTDALDDPNKWDHYISNKINDLQSSIDEQVKLLNSLTTINDKISNYGGWEKFIADYDCCIRDTLQKVEENESS